MSQRTRTLLWGFNFATVSGLVILLACMTSKGQNVTAQTGGSTFAFYSPILGSMSRYTKSTHRVLMQFFRRDLWHVSFLEPGLQTLLPKKLTLTDEGKIRELARRGEAWRTSESQKQLNEAIARGEGCVYLRLSPHQYAQLRRP